MEFSHLFELLAFSLFIVSVWHFKKSFGKENIFLFFIPAIIWGFIVELTTIKFYNIYVYPETFYLALFGVPLSIAFGWATAIYIGYFITTRKFHIKDLFGISTETAAVSMFLDFLILEPIAYFYKLWVWQHNDFWFGAPLFNFVGWFLVISIFMFSYNYVKKLKSENKQLGYFTLLLLVGLIILQVITLIYRSIFGWF